MNHPQGEPRGVEAQQAYTRGWRDARDGMADKSMTRDPDNPNHPWQWYARGFSDACAALADGRKIEWSRTCGSDRSK